jgi:hypothetical protein
MRRLRDGSNVAADNEIVEEYVRPGVWSTACECAG